MKQKPLILRRGQHVADTLWPAVLLAFLVFAPWVIFKMRKEMKKEQL